MKGEKLLIAGILVSGAIALFASSASAAPASSRSGLDFDPKLGPRKPVAQHVTTWGFPVDVYEWGAQAMRLIVASDDPLSWVAFEPPSSGEVTFQSIKGQGRGSLTQAILDRLVSPRVA